MRFHKFQPDYLKVIDTEERSNLSPDEKQVLIVTTIANLYDPLKKRHIEIKRTKKNGLSVCSRNEILSTLLWLDRGKNLIKVDPSSLPFRTIPPPFPEAGDTDQKTVKIAPTKPIKIEVLSTFHTWYSLDRERRNRTLSDVDQDQANAIQTLVFDIEKKLKIKPSGSIVLIENGPLQNTLRQDALEYLEYEEILSYELTNTFENKPKIEIFLSLEKLEKFKKKNHKFFNSSLNKTGTEPSDDNPSNKILYEITFNSFSGEVLLNNRKRLSKPNFDKESEKVIQYLIDHPKQTILKTTLENDLNIKIKSLHKILGYLGFTGVLRKTFFKTNKLSIYFRNPITETDFNESGYPPLEI